MTSLRQQLEGLTRPGLLYLSEGEGAVRCQACAHRCRIPPGRSGICQVRSNHGGVLQVPWGYVAALQADPIEKKPFFHVLPGATAFSFGMLGCNFHCPFCQNWLSSQVLRDPSAGTPVERLSAEHLVAMAVRSGAKVLASTYNEPLITSEWAVENFRLAKAQGLLTAYVSNGHATPEVLQYLRPWLDLFKVDLKAMRDKTYREMGGRLNAVLDTIQELVRLKFWVEVVTLIVPGLNDQGEELRDMARFLASVSKDIPWHVTAFHPDYRVRALNPTSPETLRKAAEIGRNAGLRFVYGGNLPGRLGTFENTLCPQCGTTLIERQGFRVVSQTISKGTCPTCGEKIPGVWTAPLLETGKA